MKLEYNLGDGRGEVEGLIGGAEVECPAVGGGGVGVFAEVEGDGAVGYWEAGCGVEEAIVVAVAGVVCHGELLFFDTAIKGVTNN